MVKHYEGDDADIKLLVGAVATAFAELTVEKYQRSATDFLADAQHPTLDRAYRECAFAPMVELLRYLESHGFTTYIASGGDRDFMRPIAADLYGLPPERVIGSSLMLDYRDDGDGNGLVVAKGLDVLDDGPIKPVRIWSRLGTPAGARRRQLERRHPDVALRGRGRCAGAAAPGPPRRRRA